jgi:N-acyl-D-aspartate/D-glutamate deacylase
MSDFDLVIHQARHDRTGALIDIGIRDGLIAALEPGGIGPGVRHVDAGGHILAETRTDVQLDPALQNIV